MGADQLTKDMTMQEIVDGRPHVLGLRPIRL